MTNPDNAVGTNAAYGGRTSVNAFNDDLGAYSRGILSGWACEPSSGLTVALGGAADTRDVAVAEDAGGNKTTINNISASPIEVTIGAAPASNTRIDAIVAYVDASPQGSATITDNYEACGLITAQGTASSTPVAPNESTIRTAITADGASGATAYYVVLAYITIANGTTTLTAANISAGEPAQLPSGALPNIPADKIDFSSFGVSDLNFGHYSSVSQGLGYGISVTLARIGNVVVLYGSPITSNSLPTVETSLPETIPSGYRPVNPAAINALCGSETDKFASWWVSISGAMSFIATGMNNAGAKRLNISAVWITQDEWPE